MLGGASSRWSASMFVRSPLSSCLIALALAVATSACGGEQVEPSAPVQVPITQLAVLGDSMASGHLVEEGQRYFELLLENDDARYPAFAGRDLRSLAPNVEPVFLATPGDLGDDTVRQAFTVPPNRTGRTLVIFSIGLNDLVRDLGRLLSPAGVVKVAEERAAHVQAIVRRFADTSRFPHGATVVALEPVDSTDGTDQVPKNLEADPMCKAYAIFVAVGGLDLFNERARLSQESEGVQTLRLERHFFGHGWFHDDPAGPAYDPGDPSLWLADCWHPNGRGSHEIRRLLWERFVAQ